MDVKNIQSYDIWELLISTVTMERVGMGLEL